MKAQNGRHNGFYDVFGQEYRSVTTIIDRLKKWGLDDWQASEAINNLFREIIMPLREGWMTLDQLKETDLERVRKDAMGESRRNRDKAGDRGREIHEIIHEFYRCKKDPGVLEGMVKYEPGLTEALQAFRKWDEDYHVEPVWAEHRVYSIANQYAGTLDLFARVILPSEYFARDDDKIRLYVIDFKSGNIDVGSVMQIAAYAKAVEEMNGTPIDGAALVQLNKETGMPKWKGFEREELELPFLMFMQVKGFYDMEDIWKGKNE